MNDDLQYGVVPLRISHEALDDLYDEIHNPESPNRDAAYWQSVVMEILDLADIAETRSVYLRRLIADPIRDLDMDPRDLLSLSLQWAEVCFRSKDFYHKISAAVKAVTPPLCPCDCPECTKPKEKVSSKWN